LIKKHVVIFFFFVSLHLIGQQNYIQYTVKDGLPQMQCTKIIQDQKGYIWIGTKWGLSKYDGIAFKNYFINNGLADSSIIDVKEGENGNIWVLTSNGLSVIVNDQIKYFPAPEGLLFKDDNIVVKGENIWIIEGYYNQKVIKFHNGTYKEKFTASKGSLSGLSFDKQNDKIVFTEVNNLGSKTYSFKNNSLKAESQIKGRKLIFNYRNNLAIKSTSKEAIIYKLSQKDTIQLLKFDKRVDIIKRVNDSTILFSTTKFASKMPVHFLINNKLKESPNYFDQINDLLQDNEGNTWVASEAGLYKITPFYNYTKKDNMPSYVWSVQEDRSNNIWFASYNNDNLFYLNENSIKKYPKDFLKTRFYMGGLQTRNGNNYFTTSNGVVVYDGNSISDLDLPENEAVLSIFEDSANSKLYFGSYRGLYIKDKFGNYLQNKNFVKGKEELILKIVKNKKNELWFVTKKSFGKINQFGEITYKNEKINSGLSIHADERGNLWIGTKNGFYFYDYKNIIKIHHAELNKMIGSVIKADENHIVYGGLRGIGMLNLEEFYQTYENLKNSNPLKIDAENFVSYYSNSHGFLGEEVGQNGMFKDSKNRVWVPTNSNVVMFNPKDLKKDAKPPNVYITKMEFSSDNINWKEFNNDKLLYNTSNNVRINYIGISYSSSKETNYKHRLKGFSDEWMNITKDRNVTYTNLKPGNYTFELKAKKSNGNWTESAVKNSFEVKAAFWQTFWFQTICVILVIGVLYQINTFLYNQRKRKVALHERLNKLQIKAIQSQLYPHLLFNAASATGSVIYKENKERAYDFVVKLSQLMRRALVDNNKPYKSLQEELEFVKTYLELQKIRFYDRFDYLIDVDVSINMELKVPQMVIQTYVENAMKHGLEPLKKGGVLKIILKGNQKNITIIIEDNGVGIVAAKKNAKFGTQSGIKIMNEIYEIHNINSLPKISAKLIDLYKLKKEGTKVIIHLKLE
jgi:ligand-binding sensor domain-containing protein